METHKRKKVCILQNGLAFGGTDTFVINLCREIDKSKFDVTVVNPCQRKESNVREPELAETGVKLIHTSDLKAGLKSKLRHLKMLYRILRKGKFDVFQTNIDLFNGPNLLVAWMAGVPIRCCHSHNSMQEREIIEGPTLTVRAYQAAMRFLCWHFANRHVGCSEKAMDFLYKGHDWHQDKYPMVINNGIYIDNFRNLTKEAIDAKKLSLGLTARHNLLTVGHFSTQKNSVFIADTIGQLLSKRKDCDFVWVGTGNKEEECRQILTRHGVIDRVHFLGGRADVNEIMQCCDLFYLPSNFEGLGIVIIEAQAAGLQCILSDVIPKEANCGGCLYLSLADSKEHWVENLNNVIDGKINFTIDEQRLQRFSVKHMAEQMQQVFQ